tara:strand:- start:447 stop:653 length:207 start_codon:yes stop_codon:yes gene_type:complete
MRKLILTYPPSLPKTHFRKKVFSQLQETSSWKQLLLDLIEVDLCLDPFIGSGTLGRVCDKFKRSFVGY